MKRGWTVGEVAARSGVAVSALHFYERKGLIRSYRTSGNQRRYAADVLRRIGIIKFAQELGIPLVEIKSAISSLPQGRSPNRADWHAISTKWSKDLDLRIERLQKLRGNLAFCIGCGCLSLRECAIRNPKDRLAEQGPGPRHLIDGPVASAAKEE
jgi:MerR family transcriptional regulator, redox-sensitive transcriptional activator SoxR